MEIKGIIFTIDALAAATIILIFIAGITTIEKQEKNNYSTQIAMDINTMSSALTDYYIGKDNKDNTTQGIIESNTAKCNSVLEYEDDGSYNEKVIKCAKLW